ncbi:MAG: hypothetical protein GY853_09400 [PVC group bacterium]|nr:hypothetical protein [PVC group bacterium]
MAKKEEPIQFYENDVLVCREDVDFSPKSQKRLNDCRSHIVWQLSIEFFFSTWPNLVVQIIGNRTHYMNVWLCGFFILFGSVTFKKYAGIIASASYAAVQTPYLFKNYTFLCMVGFYIMAINRTHMGVLEGLGGRAGTIGYVANFFTFMVAYFISFSGVWVGVLDINTMCFDQAVYDKYNVYVYTIGPVLSIFSGTICYGILVKNAHFLKNIHSLAVYGIVVIPAGLIFDTIKTPMFTTPSGRVVTYGRYFFNYWHCGSFVGITELGKYLPTCKYCNWQNISISSYISGWFLTTFNGIIKLGAKHGLVGFLAINFWVNFLKFIYWAGKLDPYEVMVSGERPPGFKKKRIRY